MKETLGKRKPQFGQEEVQVLLFFLFFKNEDKGKRKRENDKLATMPSTMSEGRIV